MRDKILVVDDMKFNRQILKKILEDDFTIIEAENGKEALNIIENQMKEIAAVLLDIVMPEMDGVTLLKILNEKQYLDGFPVLIVTAEQDLNLVAECFDYGISDFIRKPVNTDFVKQRVQKLVELYMQRNDFKETAQRQNLTLQSQYKLLQKQAAQLRHNNERIIEALGSIVESRNAEDRNHIRRVKEFTKIIGTHMMKDYPEYEITEEILNVIVSVSALHDVGKVAISDEVLLKPGKLTAEEFEYVKSHSLRGYEIIKDISDALEEDFLKYSLEVTRSHHEKYDGSGYPDGLKEDAIPISAQIVSIADCFESLLSESVYKSAIEFSEAYNMILQGECGLFSYKLLESFRKARKELSDCVANYSQELK